MRVSQSWRDRALLLDWARRKIRRLGVGDRKAVGGWQGHELRPTASAAASEALADPPAVEAGGLPGRLVICLCAVRWAKQALPRMRINTSCGLPTDPL